MAVGFKTSTRALFAHVRFEHALAKTNALRGHFDQFIVANVLEGFLETHWTDWGEADRIVRAAGAHVGQFLGLQTLTFKSPARPLLPTIKPI